MRTIEVQVWAGSPTDLSPVHWQALVSLLDAAERTSLAAFRHESDRRAYVLAHGLRRLALAQELNFEPRDLVFAHDVGGQPHLAWPRAESVFFSHSHCRGAVAFAVSRHSAVGIDIEADQTPPDADALLAPFLAPVPEGASSMAFASAPFARKWTALEAYWKACGKGLLQTNPRIACLPRQAGGDHAPGVSSQGGDQRAMGEWIIQLEGEAESAHGYVLAINSPNTPAGHVISLAMTDLALHCRMQVQVRSLRGLLGHQTTLPALSTPSALSALSAHDFSVIELLGENAPDFTCSKHYKLSSDADNVTF